MTTSFPRLLSSATNSALCSTRSEHLTRSVSNSVTRLLCSSSTQQHRDNPVTEQPPAQEESLRNDESKRNREEDKEEGEEDRDDVKKETGEVGGPKGPEPTRYGDWERNGRCYDF